jgi:hypothetical protein
MASLLKMLLDDTGFWRLSDHPCRGKDRSFNRAAIADTRAEEMIRDFIDKCFGDSPK